MLEWTPERFLACLEENQSPRVCLVSQEGRLEVSHDWLEPLAREIETLADFANHEAIFLSIGPRGRKLQSAFIHTTRRGAGAGGVRLWHYKSLERFLQDGLRLSLGMTRKNALARLWWGGGKGVIHRGELTPQQRTAVYADYGAFMTSLRGCYVTAEDAGTTPDDMATIFSHTRFTTCIPKQLGGSGNPSGPTARGVIAAIEAALEFHQMGGLKGKTLAVEGLGNVGARVVRMALGNGASRVVASEIRAERRERLAGEWKGQPVEVRETPIHQEEVDIYSPCALGGGLHPDSIPQLRCRIVCGAANNQLLVEERDGKALGARGITYVPDFLANRMGIVNCADEQYGLLDPDPAIERHLGKDWEQGIYRTTLRVLTQADREQTSSVEQAHRLADSAALEEHPIWGHRGYQIVRSLLADWRK